MKRCAPCELAVILCLTAFPSHAQSLWQWLYPAPQGNDLRAVAVVGPNTAVAVGDRGTVLETRDGGATWRLLAAVPGHPGLHGVSAAGPDAIVAVGEAGVIVRSEDGGRTWTPRSSGTTVPLLDVDFAGATHGTAVGGYGTILATADGGLTWHAQDSRTTAWLEGVSRVDADIGFAVGGGVLKTVDGGATWVPLDTGAPGPLVDVDFADAGTGIAVGFQPTESGEFSGPLAVRTTDGGATWSSLPSPLPGWPVDESLLAVCVFDALHAFAVGRHVDHWCDIEEGLLLATADGGASWSAVQLENNMHGVAVFSGTEGVVAGAAGYLGRLLPGGGVTKVGGGTQNFEMRAVDFVDARRGVALASPSGWCNGPFGIVRTYATTDGGKTWNLGIIGDGVAFDVACADSTTLYAVGIGPWVMDVGAMIFRSTDGGRFWEGFSSWHCNPSAPPPCIRRLTAVDFAGPGAGVAVGDGTIVTILGGSPSWTVLDDTGELGLWAVSVPSERTAYVAGSRLDRGLILKGTLADGSWVELTNPGIATWPPFSGVCFTDDSTGTVVAGGGLILRTTDGGATWKKQTSGGTGDLTHVSFSDARNGVLLRDGALLATADGGSTWVAENLPLAATDVACIGPHAVVAAGGSECILEGRGVAVPVLLQDVVALVEPLAVELRWVVRGDGALDGFRVDRTDWDAGTPRVRSTRLSPAERSFLDDEVTPGTSYEYVVSAIDASGIAASSQPLRVSLPHAALALSQNHPNPFNPTTRIRFVLPARMRATLSVHDVAGRRIATLVDGILRGGAHDVTWDGRSTAGDPVGSGVYFCELRTPQGAAVRKMAVVK